MGERIPFKVARDNFNAETLEAFREVEEMKKNPSGIKTYDNFSDILKEIEVECTENNRRGCGTSPEFLSCGWNVIEIARSLILNGFYISGLWPSTYLYSGIKELMKSYVEILLFLIHGV